MHGNLCITSACRVSFQATIDRFRKFDVDGDGVLSREEVTAMVVSLGYAVDDDYVSHVMQMFGTMDRSGNGLIELDEFG